MNISTKRCRMLLMRQLAAAALVTGAVTAHATAEEPVDLFLSRVEKNASLPADAKQLIRSTWTQCQDCDPGEFLIQGLAVMSEPFRKGLDAYDAGNYAECTQVLEPLRGSDDPFVAVHASVYAIKALVAEEQLLEALSRINDLLDGRPVEESPVAFHSYMTAELTFLQGFCLLADLQYDQAGATLRHFLEFYPDASSRLHVAAQQMLAELQTREPEKIGEVYDLMNFSGRRLSHGDSGEIVQTRQDRVIELLDKLIEEAEEKENQSNSSSSGGSSGGSNQPQGGQAPNTPMQDSMLPGGQAKDGTLRARRRANPGDMWGSMPPAERERILQALRDNFPSRYRQLVEQYYEELAKKP